MEERIVYSSRVEGVVEYGREGRREGGVVEYGKEGRREGGVAEYGREGRREGGIFKTKASYNLNQIDVGSEGSYGLIEATHPTRGHSLEAAHPTRGHSRRETRGHVPEDSDSDIHWSDNPDRLI